MIYNLRFHSDYLAPRQTALIAISAGLMLSGCGVDSKPTIPTAQQTTTNVPAATDNYRVRVVASQTQLQETDAAAAFNLVYVHKDTTQVLDKYTAPQDIKISYQLGCGDEVAKADAAVAATDYTAAVNGEAIIAKGKNTVTIHIPLRHNKVPTADKRLCLRITGVSDQSLLDDSRFYRESSSTIKNVDLGVAVQNSTAVKDDAQGTLNFVVTSNQAVSQDSKVMFAIMAGTAVEGRHYQLPATNQVTIKKGEKTAMIAVPLIGEQPSQDLMLTVKLLAENGALTPVHFQDTAIGAIVVPKRSEPAKRAKVHTTGINFSATNTNNDANCKDLRQDCQNPPTMQFTKLDAAGNALPSAAKDWACFRDDHTGLIWESKTYTPSIQGLFGAAANANKDFRDIEISQYTYRDNFYRLGVIDTGLKSGKDDCQQSDAICTTANYTKKVNQLKLCGLDNWRLPNRHELFNLINLQHTADGKKALPTHMLVKSADDYKLPSSFWTQSRGRQVGTATLDQIWMMYTDGTASLENPNSTYSTAQVVLVSNGR